MLNILDKVIAHRRIKKALTMITCLKVGYPNNPNASFYVYDLDRGIDDLLRALKFLGTKSIKHRSSRLKGKIAHIDHLAKEGIFRLMQG